MRVVEGGGLAGYANVDVYSKDSGVFSTSSSTSSSAPTLIASVYLENNTIGREFLPE